MPYDHPDWIDTYGTLVAEQVSPEIFHRWSAVAVLGAALERRVWLKRGFDDIRVYPGQLMVVLVGASAMQKKTTAANLAMRFAKDLPPWAVNILPKKTSPQQLMQELERKDEEKEYRAYPPDVGLPDKLVGRRVNSSGFINAGELAVFFSTDAFNETLATTITDLNDAERGKVTVKYRKYQVDLWNPVVGMIGCITPTGIAKELPKAARSAGFFGRILWVFSNAALKFNPLTTEMPEEPKIRAVLKRGIAAMARMYGPMHFSRKGKAWFDAWYLGPYAEKVSRLESLGIFDSTGYWGRKDAHLLRVAMVLSASRSWGRDYIIRTEDLIRAEAYLAEIEKGFDGAMAEIGVSASTEENRRVLQYFEKHAGRAGGEGWVPDRKVLHFLSMTLGMKKFQSDDCLERLKAAGEVEQRWVAGEREWRRVWSSGNLIKRAAEER